MSTIRSLRIYRTEIPQIAIRNVPKWWLGYKGSERVREWDREIEGEWWRVKGREREHWENLTGESLARVRFIFQVGSHLLYRGSLSFIRWTTTPSCLSLTHFAKNVRWLWATVVFEKKKMSLSTTNTGSWAAIVFCICRNIRSYGVSFKHCFHYGFPGSCS